jgi:hypothetical protein
MRKSPYDLSVLQERAALWRSEAAAARFEAMRRYCLNEAHLCEQRVQMSLSTPVILERAESAGTPAHIG